MSTRTFTYKVNMDLSGVNKGTKTMQVSLASIQGNAKNVDAQMGKLAETIGKRYGVKVDVARDQTKTFQNAIKEAAREANRSEKNFQRVTQEFSHMTKAVGMSDDALQVLNAQMRLGANATEAQKQEVAELVTEYQRLRNAANKTQGSMRGLRGQASNVGFQLQDIAVQAQMGTNALVILGQQGSQLLGGFGAKGALAGAGLAILTAAVYALAPAFIDSGKAAKELNEELVKLSKLKGLGKAATEVLIAEQNKLIKANEKETKQLNDRIKNRNNEKETYDEYLKRKNQELELNIKLGTNQKVLIKNQDDWIISTNTASSRLEVLADSTKAANDEITRIKDSLNGGTDELEKNRTANEELTKNLQEQVEVYGLTEVQLLRRAKALSLVQLAEQGAEKEQVASVTANYDTLISLQELADETENYEKFLADLTVAEKKAKTSTNAHAKSIESMITTLKRRSAIEGVNSIAIEEINRQMAIATIKSGEHTQAQIDEVNAYYRNIIAVKILANAEKERAEERKQQLADDKKRIKAINDEADAYDAFLFKLGAAKSAQTSKKAKAELDQELKDYDDFIKSLEKAAEERNNVLATRSESGRLAALQADYNKELSLAQGNAEAIAGIEDHYARERIKINGTAWEQMAVNAIEALEDTDKIMAQQMDRLVSSFGSAMADMALGSKKPADALKDMFAGAIGSMVQFFAEWAAQKLILWALDKTLGASTATSHAGAMAANTGAKVAEAGLNAFASTAAIPIVGPFLAPAAAATAIAATTPMAATATTLASLGIGAFDKGGRIAAGGMGIVSELGDELVGGTMVYNGSPNSLGVTGREDTARRSGGSSPVNITVNSSGNASPEAISRALVRALKRKNKGLDTGIYDSMNRGRNNRGKRFNA